MRHNVGCGWTIGIGGRDKTSFRAFRRTMYSREGQLILLFTPLGLPTSHRSLSDSSDLLSGVCAVEEGFSSVGASSNGEALAIVKWRITKVSSSVLQRSTLITKNMVYVRREARLSKARSSARTLSEGHQQ